MRNIEQSAETLAKSLSVTFNLWTIAPEHCFVLGKPSSFTFRVALATVGGANLELVSPATGESVYDDHLRLKGEGFHHICLAYADLESMQYAKEALKGQGYDMIQHGYTEGAFEFCYFALTDPNMLVELLFLKGLPPPEKTIG